MTRIFLVLSALCLLVSPASAASKKEPSAIQYVGSVSINPSQDAKVLAEWYTRFGIQTEAFSDGGFYKVMDTAAGQFFFAIHPKSPDAAPKSSGSVSFVFRVSDFDSYLANLASNNLVPTGPLISDPKLGRFASFSDPDGNEVTIWGK